MKRLLLFSPIVLGLALMPLACTEENQTPTQNQIQQNDEPLGHLPEAFRQEAFADAENYELPQELLDRIEELRFTQGYYCPDSDCEANPPISCPYNDCVTCPTTACSTPPYEAYPPCIFEDFIPIGPFNCDYFEIMDTFHDAITDCKRCCNNSCGFCTQACNQYCRDECEDVGEYMAQWVFLCAAGC